MKIVFFSETDPTAAKTILPKTGMDLLIWMGMGVTIAGIGIFSYLQYRKNNF